MLPHPRTSIALLVLLSFLLIFPSINQAEDTILRTPVVSSSLTSVGYDEQQKLLEIEFRNGCVYRYMDVPREFFAQFMAANSKGRFFVLKIRGKFTFTRVSASSIAGQ